VTVAMDAQYWRPQHVSIATGSIDPSDERLAIVETSLPDPAERVS